MNAVLLLLMLTASFATTTRGQQSAATQRVADPTKKVCIVGNVMKQREVSFDERLTVTDAIKQAGGIRPDRKDNQVIVISQMAGPAGGMRIIFVDLKAIKRRPYKDLELQDRDIIEVLSRKPEKIREPFINPCPWVPVFKDRM